MAIYMWREYSGWLPDITRTIFYYEFENNLNDSSGNSNNPIASSAVGYEEIGGQYVAKTTTTSPYIKLSTSYGNNLTDFTISFWIYPKKGSGQGDVMVFGSFESGSPFKGPTIFFLSGGNILVRMTMNNGQQPCTWTQDTWQHIVFTRSSGTCSLYKNGTLQGSSWSDTTTWNSQIFYIFSRNDNSQQFKATGTMGDKYIYENVAWSAQDVLNYYNQTKGIYGIS